MSEPTILRVTAQPLTAAAFAKYGVCSARPERGPDWIASGSRVDGVREDKVGQGKTVANLWNLGDLRFEGDVPYVGYVHYFNQGFRVSQLERHLGETQTWIARRGAGFLVVAPATGDGPPPAPESAEAFIIQPGDLVAMGSGVWMCHFFPLSVDAEYLVITGRREPEQDRDLVNLVQTANTILEITL